MEKNHFWPATPQEPKEQYGREKHFGAQLAVLAWAATKQSRKSKHRYF